MAKPTAKNASFIINYSSNLNFTSCNFSNMPEFWTISSSPVGLLDISNVTIYNCNFFNCYGIHHAGVLDISFSYFQNCTTIEFFEIATGAFGFFKSSYFLSNLVKCF